jgi:hypothetical protein
MFGRLLALSTSLLLVAAPPGRAAIQLEFDYRYDTSGFFSDPERKSALEAAASHYESILLDTLAEIRVPPLTNNQWTAQFTQPATGQLASLDNLRVGADQLIIFVGARNLDGESIGFGGPGGYEVSGTMAWVETVSTRGEANTQGDGATDFAPWGGSIAFDTTLSTGSPRIWSFDTAAQPPAGHTDFLTTAIHEIGHVLGFGTGSSFTHWVDENSGTFTGPASQMENNGSIPLNSDNAHWAEKVRGANRETGLPVETSFDPTQSSGARKLLTRLDLAALEDIGWEIRPEPLILAADLNGDGRVNSVDFQIMNANLGTGTTRSQGDINADRVIDLRDLVILKYDFGRTGGSGATSVVPEPSAITLAWLAIALLIGWTIPARFDSRRGGTKNLLG